MNSFFKYIFIAMFAVISFSSVAGSTEGVLNVKIKGISTHDTSPQAVIFLVLSDGSVAYFDSDKKELHSLALSAFMAGKTITVWRYKAGFEGSGGSFWLGGHGNGSASSYKVHRIDVLAN